MKLVFEELQGLSLSSKMICKMHVIKFKAPCKLLTFTPSREASFDRGDLARTKQTGLTSGAAKQEELEAC